MLNSFEVFGIERIYRNDQTGEMPGFWTELQQNGECVRLVNAAGWKDNGAAGRFCLMGICGYCELDEQTFPYMICTEKTPKSNTDGYKVWNVPKTTWVVFRSGMLDSVCVEIPELFSRAYIEWLPSSGYDKAIGPDMEIFGIADSGKYYEEVWIPDKKA